MNESRFTCFFKNTTPDALKAAWGTVLSEATFKEKVTMTGVELNLDNEQIDLYLYTTTTPEGPGDHFLAEGEFIGDMKAMLTFFQDLGQHCTEQNLVYEFELYEETEDGDQVGDSTTLRHGSF